METTETRSLAERLVVSKPSERDELRAVAKDLDAEVLRAQQARKIEQQETKIRVLSAIVVVLVVLTFVVMLA